ncbi:hypothetical protein [Selenomonas sp.]|uniref:hypothetical protein n=1 Tax=Selenomonas sp. TaxID=2053611 RepID=UPI0025DBF1D9|nr:hypothetical protein [Selenomonas sp.]MCI6284887.1 hypothetical protein [Selenomonas sp.]
MKQRHAALLRSALAATLSTPFFVLQAPAYAAVRTADPAPDDDGYVELVEPVQPQADVTRQALGDAVPHTVHLVDAQATPRTARLAAFLAGIGRSPFVLYGHQNDLHHKVNTAARTRRTRMTSCTTILPLRGWISRRSSTASSSSRRTRREKGSRSRRRWRAS